MAETHPATLLLVFEPGGDEGRDNSITADFNRFWRVKSPFCQAVEFEAMTAEFVLQPLPRVGVDRVH